MVELKEIAKNNGMTMKGLAESSNIKYTTLMSMSKTPVNNWNEETLNSLAKALHLTQDELIMAVNGIVLTPFIKWVGGKRQLLPKLQQWMPKKYDRYFEAFIGGGAFLLNTSPKKAVINDFNPELVNVWKSVRDDVDELAELLKEYEIRDSKEFYLNIRSADRDGRIINMTPVERAARFIYMNKAGYNGLWRVNLRGQNNVPYGGHSKLTLVTQNLFNVSEYLKVNDIDIRQGDYRDAVCDAQTGDFVYFDPPYIPMTETASFTSYTKEGFGLVQQEQLRDLAIALSKRGVKVMLSNSDVPLIKELYKSSDGFHIHKVQATRFINSNAQKRGKIGEVIITTY